MLNGHYILELMEAHACESCNGMAGIDFGRTSENVQRMEIFNCLIIDIQNIQVHMSSIIWGWGMLESCQ